MTLDPQLAPLIDMLDAGFPPVHTMNGAEARALIRSRFVPPPKPQPVAEVRDDTIDGPGADIPVRVYRPDSRDTSLPILVYAHGGGFVFCDLDSHDALCRDITNRIPAVVVSVDYRLAPEHRWPAAADDVYAVVRWAARNAADLGGDPNRLAVGGDSAGGNLAAVTALMARDRGDPPLAAQFLIYPVLAANFQNESYRLFGRGFYNPKPALQWYWEQYVPSVADRAHPYATPINADLRGLAPAVMVIAGHDPLRDEGLAFGAALQNAGVPTVQLRYDGGIHGFMTMPMLDLAHRARAEAAAALAGVLRR
ncbi:alpha/beta hydrolase [Mycobacterium sp. 1081908.1]|uniref:alpha/beta hydrolase n=1 Tax=Mycobacterium sp. 1081908.1 TaxID=1834066 RepID=UPI0007FC7771|nr:alpha/beta hydrolase [Mycobacterium sp. 1081908.1]OBK48197.1 esterase [Mycobacterium sp. 1081908.1]